MRGFPIIIALAAAVSGLCAAEASGGPSPQDRKQAACFADVQRLCADTLPDADRTKACMKDKRSKVSAACAKYWDVKD